MRKRRNNRRKLKGRPQAIELAHGRTLLLFVILTLCLDLAVCWAGRRGWLFPFEVFNASVATALLNLVGITAGTRGNIIAMQAQTWLITTDCTALLTMAMFAAFVIVYPSRPRQKLAGLGMGLVVIFAANMARLTVMAWLLRYNATLSARFHDYLWQVGFIIMVVALWLLWIEKVVKGETNTAGAG